MNVDQAIPRDINILTKRAGLCLVVVAVLAWVLKSAQVQFPVAGVVVAYFYALSFIVVNRLFPNPGLVVFSLIRILFFGYVIGGVIAHSPAQIALVLCGFLGYLIWLMTEFVILPLLRPNSP